MKQYPSIGRSTGQTFHEFTAYVFDKLDGSNLRFEWNRKQGWYKAGRRHGLLDDSNTALLKAPAIFAAKMAEPLAKIARDERWESVVVFAELWGPNSLAGYHDTTDEMKLTLFDVNPFKKGILGPSEFRKLFEGVVETPNFLGIHKWTRGFVEQVWKGEVPGVTFEGVVGKAKEGKHDLVMYKAKTQAWVERVKSRHTPETAEKIINS